MKTLRDILIAAALLAAAFTTRIVNAQVPTSDFQSITLPATVAIAAAPTNFASPPIIDCRKQHQLILSFTVSSADGGSTTNAVFHGQWSADGSNYDTNHIVTVQAVVQGTVPRTTTTNITTLHGAFLKIYDEQIGDNSKITNNAAGYRVQISTP